jgi:lipopolysaccharide transport system permease protein
MHLETIYLAKALTQKELLIRYRGSLLGFGWMLVLPIVMATLYTTVFWGVFNARWPGGPIAADSHPAIQFGTQLFAGLIVFNFFVDLMVRSSRLIAEHATLVKRVRFPQMALVLAMLFSGLITLSIGMAISLVGVVIATQGWQINLFALVLVLTQATILALGFGLWISALAVYLRDIQHVMPAVATGLLFLSPVFYSSQTAPGLLGEVITYNPLSFSIEGVRRALFYADTPDWQSTMIAFMVGLAVLLTGYAVFRRLKPGFSDLI